jgi:hypothetical protein
MSAETIEKVVRNSPRYTWMAEYHNSCVDRIVKLHAGGSDSILEVIPSFMGRPDAENMRKGKNIIFKLKVEIFQDLRKNCLMRNMYWN